MQTAEPTFQVLSLPELPLFTVVRCLTRSERRSLAGSCRMLAMAVSAASNGAHLYVRPTTGWEGLFKILSTSTMACKKLVLLDFMYPHEKAAKSNAFDVLLKPEALPQFVLEGIKELLMLGCRLPCFVPPTLARVLPDLQSLRLIHAKWNQHTDLQPIPYCSSIRTLQYTDFFSQPHLPSRYHTAEDLRRQLPNIDTLEMLFDDASLDKEKANNCANTMLQAWGDKLTKLTMNIDIATPKLHFCKCLQSFEYVVRGSSPKPFSITFLPPSLTDLVALDGYVRESDLGTILQLPLLCKVQLLGFTQSLQHDWSDHPCTWHELCIKELHMADLGKLPLTSLKGPGCLKVCTLTLPDPRLPNSLANVTYAAQCVCNAGVTVEGFEGWRCELWSRVPANAGEDTASAQVVHAAGRAVKAFSTYRPGNFILKYYPQTVTALIRCASLVLQEIHIKSHAEEPDKLSVWLWQASQCCSNLKQVCFNHYARYSADCNITADVVKQVQLAAEHFVAANKRPLKLTFKGWCGDRLPNDILRREIQDKLHSDVGLRECSWDTDCSCLHVLLGPEVRLTEKSSSPGCLAVQEALSACSPRVPCSDACNKHAGQLQI